MHDYEARAPRCRRVGGQEGIVMAKAATAEPQEPPHAPTAPPPPTRRARWRSRPVIVGAVLLIAALVGLVIWRVFFSTPALPPGVIAVSGGIEGDASAISPKTSGRIQEITVREGDRVDAGALIAVLDDEQVRAREEQAKAMVRQADARLAA